MKAADRAVIRIPSTFRAILDAALELDSSAREAFIADACGGDAALLAELRKMLAAYEAMPIAFLAQPAVRGTAVGGSDLQFRTDAGIQPAAEHPGQRIGHYKLREQIGEGGFGTVWVADQEQPVRRRVALMIIKLGMDTREVIDFGVAKATQSRLSDGTIYTQFHQMIGTPLYMSPEQAELTSLDVDTRSDIYALGVLLYELLTGRTPIDTATMALAGMDEVRRLIREVDPPRPSDRVKTLAGHELTTTAHRRHTEPAKLPDTLRGDIDWKRRMAVVLRRQVSGR